MLEMGKTTKEYWLSLGATICLLEMWKTCMSETIAVHSLRLARLLSHEQKVLGISAPFEVRSMDKILRYESTVSRRLEKATDELGRLQEARKAESNQNTDAATDEGFEAPEEPMPEEPQDGSGCSNLPDAPLTTGQPHVETNAKQVSAPTEAEPSNKPAEPAANNPPPPEKCVPNAGAQTLANAIEQAMGTTPAEQQKSGLGSREIYGTDAIGGSSLRRDGGRCGNGCGRDQAEGTPWRTLSDLGEAHEEYQLAESRMPSRAQRAAVSRSESESTGLSQVSIPGS